MEDARITSRKTVKSAACRDTDLVLSILLTEMGFGVEPDIVQSGDGSREYANFLTSGTEEAWRRLTNMEDELAFAAIMRMPY